MANIFKIGDLYSHEEIYRSLEVGNAGGIRFLKNTDDSTRRAVLFTSVPEGRLSSENPYQDRIENDILIYTAQGRMGDQGLGGQNQRLLEHGKFLFPIYCFQLICSRRNRSVGVKRWRFVGFLFKIRQYKEQQIDIHGEMREAHIFEFAVLQNFSSVAIDKDYDLAVRVYTEFISSDNNSLQDEEVADIKDKIDNRDDKTEIESIRSKMLALHPQRFEVLIKDVLQHSGFENVCTTKYSQDGGIDVEAYAGDSLWALRGMHLQVQAKRWIHTVGRREVAELRGSLGQFARGMIVTTSQFSKSAIKEASEDGKLPIVMIDGYDFSSVVKKAGIVL